MRWQVIGHNDAARLHFGDQAFFEPLLEDFAGHRARDQLWRKDSIMLETGYECRCHPVAVRGFGQQLFTLLAPAPCSDHARCRASFINKDKRPEVQSRLIGRPYLPCQGNIGAILFTGIYRFF